MQVTESKVSKSLLGMTMTESLTNKKIKSQKFY
jgi:hypothetical protein